MANNPKQLRGIFYSMLCCRTIALIYNQCLGPHHDSWPLNQTLDHQQRIIPVGTTSLRTLGILGS
jgi:hypothetical protein